MSLIGVDLGTSFIKAAVLNLDTLRPEHVERTRFPAALSGLPPTFCEFDPNEIVVAVRGLLDQLASHAIDCEGVLWTTQMHGLVFCDGHGRAHSNASTWLDQRVILPHPSGQGTYFDILASRLTAAERQQLGGTELRPGLPIGTLFWLAESGQLPPPELVPASLADFVLANLCGGRPVTESSNAQAHGALNLDTDTWHRGVIEKLGVAMLAWPEIKPQGTVVGHLKIGARTVPVFTPVGDFQCALAGALVEPGELSLNISTGSQVSLVRQRVEYGPYQTRPFFDGEYLNTITTIPAGRALNALVKLLCEIAVAQDVVLPDPWSYIAGAASAANDPTMQVDLSFFASAIGDEGSFTHVREPELTVGHVFRAAFRNMADNYHACALRLCPEQAWRGLVYSGGLVQKIDLLRDLISRRFAVPHRICPHSEDTLLGLIVLGLAFTGREPSVRQAMQTVRNSF